MPDYSKGKIYNIVCNITGETYYGSTVQKICKRMNGHRNKNNECLSKQIIERGDYHYGLVEDYKCDNLEQLLMRERYYVDNNDCVNKVCPIRTKEELAAKKAADAKAYREENKEEIVAKAKAYREENKEEIAAYQKVYNQVYQQENKEELTAYRKAYREENKEEIAAYSKAYNQENKDKIAAKKKVYNEANREKINAKAKAKYRDTKRLIHAKWAILYLRLRFK